MKELTVGLVGNPNTGKTTVFNALTGARQKVGNWSGVTVEKRVGYYCQQECRVNVVDLPGIYSLVNVDGANAPDVAIASQYIHSRQADILINVIDAANLERNLYLTMQLIEMGTPLIVAVNMLDIAKKRRMQIDISALEAQLGCRVIALRSNKDKGISQLTKAIAEVNLQEASRRLPYHFPAVINTALTKIQTRLSEMKDQAEYVALRLLEGDQTAAQQVSAETLELVHEKEQEIQASLEEEADIIIADQRYGFVHQVCQNVFFQDVENKRNVTEKIDRIVLNRYLGIPIFFAVMYLTFLFSINIAGAFQDFFDITTNTIFVQGLAHLLYNWHFPDWAIAILASGVGKGINTTLTFIPVIGGMFLFLAILENSGYMARAAFVMDRLMQTLGLPGNAFVPMIIGFGCNVPAILATRTLENRRDRLLTILMSPFMSCGARLTIFAVMTAAFFPRNGQNVGFLLYLIGILAAVLTGFILRKTLLKGHLSPFIIELPPYHVPSLRSVLAQTWSRLKHFLFRAGKVIVPVCMVIGALNSISLQGVYVHGDASQHSILSLLGRSLTPLFSPMGIEADNWPATVGLLTGSLAKEVLIATLNTLYTEIGDLATTVVQFDFWGGLHAAVASIPENLKVIPSILSNPIAGSAPEHSVHDGVYGVMYQHFSGQRGAFAYLLFVLLYVPCVSTTAVMARELNKGWAVFSVIWSVSLAYGVSVLYYQIATFSLHPHVAIAWIIAICASFLITVLLMQFYANSEQAFVNPVRVA